MDDVSAHMSSSPSAAHPIKSEEKSLGSVPGIARHIRVSELPSTSSGPPLATTSPASISRQCINEGDACRTIEELEQQVKRLAEQIAQKDEGAKQLEGRYRKKEREAKQTEAELKKMEEEFQLKEVEAMEDKMKLKEIEAREKDRQMEAERKAAHIERKEEGIRLQIKELHAREQEIQRREQDVDRKEAESMLLARQKAILRRLRSTFQDEIHYRRLLCCSKSQAQTLLDFIQKVCLKVLSCNAIHNCIAFST